MLNHPLCARRLPLKRVFFTGLVLLISCVPQYNSHAETPPDPPLIADAPNPGAWTIEVQNKKPRKALPNDPAKAYIAKRIRDVYPLLVRETIERSGKDSHREKFYDNQKMDNIWVSKGMVVFQLKHFPVNKAIAVPVNNRISPVKSGSGPDFPELAWIDQKFFVGTVTYKGHRCYFYRNSNAKALEGADELAEVPESGEISAWIDADTRLPIAVEDANLLKTYTYLPGPAKIQRRVFLKKSWRAPLAR